MLANSKPHAISQTAYTGADGNLYVIWETAYSVKGLKVHFVIHSLILFSSKKVEIFTSAKAFRYTMFVCKIFLANSFVW